MGFNPRNMDTRYTDMLLNFFGDIAKKEWEESRKQAQYKKNLEILKAGGFGDIYPKGISSEGQPEYGIRTPEDKMKLVDQMNQFKRNQDIGKYEGAKATLTQPPVSTMERPRLLAMPKEQAKQEITNRLFLRPQARETISKTPAELQGRNFIMGAEGKYREMPKKATTDAERNIIGYRPKGAIFQPKGEGKGKTLTAPMVDKISKNEDAYYTLGSSFDALKTNTNKFAQFMGPWKQALRSPFRSYVNKDLKDFLAWRANVQDAFQQYRVAVTGAQASDKEIALLAKNRPTEDDTYDVFIKKTNEVRKIGNQVIKRYITNLGKAGYNISGYQDTLDNLNEELGNLTKKQGNKIGKYTFTIGE